MTQFQFKLPDIGEGTVEAEIAAWHVKVGDRVAEDQPLVDMMTDKATVELTSPATGVVQSIAGKPGDRIAVGSVLVTFDTDAAPVNAKAAETKAAAPVSVTTASGATAAAPAVAREVANDHDRESGQSDRVAAAPAVRRRAKDMGIDIRQVPGTGPEGRVVDADLKAYAGAGAAVVTGKRTAVEDIPVIGLRRQIAERMQLAKRHIPHFSYVEEVDMTALEDLRATINAAKKPQQPKLTLLPFLIQSLVRALPEFPGLNALYDDEAGVIHRHAGVHVGIATQTDKGLMVPVLRHAEARDIWDMAREILRLAEAARSGKAAREELTGSTITLSSLGPLAGIASGPVINRPEVAILAPNKIVERAVVKNGQVVVRKMMNISSSFDHRVVDGADAANFIQRLKGLLEQPALLFVP